MMRIITGTARGAKLATLEGDNTRPTSERAKEAVFSMIQFEIEGRRALDLFSGSGQMGLEAASRGALSVSLVDSSKEAVEIIKKNVEKTRLSDKCRVYDLDYVEFIKTHSRSEKYDIVFIDPPYASKLVCDALLRLVLSCLLNPNALVVCESGEENTVMSKAELARHFELVRKAKYGVAFIELLRFTG